MELSRTALKAKEYYSDYGLKSLLTEGGKFCTTQTARRVAPRSRFISLLYNKLRVYDRSDLGVYADTVFPYGNADAIEINAPPCNTDIPPEISHWIVMARSFWMRLVHDGTGSNKDSVIIR